MDSTTATSIPIDSATLGGMLAADIHQIVVVLICVIIFLYVRLACGEQARYFVHLAFAYIGIGLIYFFHGVTESWSYFTGSHQTSAFKTTIEVVSSSLSILNTMFFFTTWYLMRHLRQEQKIAPQTATATMSNPFASTVIGVLATAVATYIATVNLMIQNGQMLFRIFSGLDISLAAASIALVGWEFLWITRIRNHEEGSLFDSNITHRIFCVLTFVLFLAFSLLQFSFFFSIIPQEPPRIFKFPTGEAYYWLAALRILCAGAAAMLGLHALPSARWKHKQLTADGEIEPPKKD
jgi:hypothetical protein